MVYPQWRRDSYMEGLGTGDLFATTSAPQPSMESRRSKRSNNMIDYKRTDLMGTFVTSGRPDIHTPVLPSLYNLLSSTTSLVPCNSMPST